jgi:hypothetical protein
VRCLVRRLGLCLEVDSPVLPGLDSFVLQAIQRFGEREADGAALRFVGVGGLCARQCVWGRKCRQFLNLVLDRVKATNDSASERCRTPALSR